MAVAKLTQTQASFLRSLRSLGVPDDTRKQMKKDLFAVVREAHPYIPSSAKLVVEIDDTTSPKYLVLRDKRTDETFSPAVDWVRFNLTDVITLLREEADSDQDYCSANSTPVEAPAGVEDGVEFLCRDGYVYVTLG